MRKLHLRIAEWRYLQSLEYGRFYRLICCWAGEKTPTPAEVFPMLDMPEQEQAEADDFTLFSQAAAHLGAS